MSVWLCWLLFACGAPPEEDTGFDTAPAASVALTPNWQGVLDLIATDCAQCHLADSPTGPGIVLERALRDDLQTGAGRLVVPGDPEGSMLWDRLVGGPSGESMPWGGALLPPERVQHVREWIRAGASLPD